MKFLKGLLRALFFLYWNQWQIPTIIGEKFYWCRDLLVDELETSELFRES